MQSKTSKYYVLPSWDNPGWTAVVYDNAACTPTLLCDVPGQQTANQIAKAMNKFAGAVTPVEEFSSVTWPGVTITLKSDDGLTVVGQLRLTIKQLHAMVENALLERRFDYAQFLNSLGVYNPQEQAEERTFAVLNDYLGNEIPFPNELIWNALVFGMVGAS